MELPSVSRDEGGIPDERLALLFVCAHPAIEESFRAPLMLQTVLGLDARKLAAPMGERVEAIYASYTDVWVDPAQVADEALFLARLAAEMMPGEPEALRFYADARRAARLGWLWAVGRAGSAFVGRAMTT